MKKVFRSGDFIYKYENMYNYLDCDKILSENNENVTSKYCKSVKNHKNDRWMLVFYHNSSNGLFYNEFEEIKFQNDYKHGKYSIFGLLQSDLKQNNKFEFLLEYPELNGYNLWRQSNNPIEENKLPDIVFVKGYEEINVQFTMNCWHGLSLSDSDKTFIDGSNCQQTGQLENYYYYSIGATSAWLGDNCFAGPEKCVHNVYLWVRMSPPTQRPRRYNKVFRNTFRNLIVF